MVLSLDPIGCLARPTNLSSHFQNRGCAAACTCTWKCSVVMMIDGSSLYDFITSTSVEIDLYAHMPDYVTTPRHIQRTAHLYRDVCCVPSLMRIYFAVASRFVRFWASGGTKFPKMGDSLPRTPLNHHAKFDAASFIIAGEIRNRTNTQKTNKQ